MMANEKKNYAHSEMSSANFIQEDTVLICGIANRIHLMLSRSPLWFQNYRPSVNI